MRIGDYVVRPDGGCWIVANVKTYLTGSERGEEYEADVVYPGRFDQALRTLLDRQVRDGLEPCDGRSRHWKSCRMRGSTGSWRRIHEPTDLLVVVLITVVALEVAGSIPVSEGRDRNWLLLPWGSLH